MHNDQVEGWVAEFPAGYLATFNPQPVPPSNTSIVGAWRVNDTESGSPAVVVFMADGTYYLINPTVTATEVNAAPGFERGLYTWDGATGAFTVTTLNDTNGDAGLSDNDGMLNATVFVSGDTFSLTPGGATIGTRIAAPANTPLGGTIVGAWVVGNPAAADSSFVAVFDSDGRYYHAQDGANAGGSPDGVEKGTYSWSAGTLTPSPSTLTPTATRACPIRSARSASCRRPAASRRRPATTAGWRRRTGYSSSPCRHRRAST